MSEWISVKDRLPEKPLIAGQVTPYLVSNGAGVVISSYTSIGHWVYGNLNITHWQPLPEPPKENCK